MKAMLIPAALCLAMVPMQAEAAPAASVTPKAMKDANTTIAYTNSVLSFLSEWYVTRYMEQNDNSYHENINRGPQDGAYHQDEFDSSRQWSTEADLVQQLGGVSPRNPPATIGAENQRFFTTELANLDRLIAAMKVENGKMRQYFDRGLRLINPANRAGAQSELAQYDALLKQILVQKDKIYDRVYLVGDAAEEITLSHHPLKKEIMDMKKSMRLAEKIAIGSQGDAAAFAANLPQLDAMVAQLKAYSGDYTNYKIVANSNNPRLNYIRSNVKEFFDEFDGFYRAFNDLKANYQGNLDYQRPAKQRNLAQRYKELVGKYNEFVDSNNR